MENILCSIYKDRSFGWNPPHDRDAPAEERSGVSLTSQSAVPDAQLPHEPPSQFSSPQD